MRGHLFLRAICAIWVLASLGIAPGIAQAQATATPAPPAVADTPVVRSGTFKSVAGNVRVQSPSGQTRAAQSGDALAAQERVITGTDGSAALTLRDGTVIAVGPSSNVGVNAFSFDATTHNGSLIVSVLQGSIRMLTGLLAKLNPQSVQVQTPTALVGVRGTDFIVEVPQP
jgi:hypothetical protein